MIKEKYNVLTHVEFEDRLVPLQELGRLLRILLYESFNYNLIEVRWLVLIPFAILLMARV